MAAALLAVVTVTGNSSAARAELTGPLDTVEAAVAAWSTFATSGDFSSVDPWFVVGGPQWEQFETEAAKSSQTAAIRFAVLDSVIRAKDDEWATVWARVEISRHDYRSEIFEWDFDLVHTSDGWRVWTVVPAERPSPEDPPVVVRGSSAATEGTGVGDLSTTTTLATAVLSPAKPAPSEAGGVRLPAMAAWIVVVTLIGVAATGYLAPRLDRRGD